MKLLYGIVHFAAAALLAASPAAARAEAAPDAAARSDAHAAIQALQARYFEIVDLLENKREGRPAHAQAVDELFTDDASWVLENDGQVITEEIAFHGRDALVEFARQLEGRYVEGVYIKHFGMNPQIEVNGDRATATEELLMLVSDKKKNTASWYLGTYRDTLLRGADGRWRFSRKTLRMGDFTSWPTTAP